MTIKMERNDNTTFMVIVELHNHHRNVYGNVVSVTTKNENISIIYEDDDFLSVAKYSKEVVLNLTIVG